MIEDGKFVAIDYVGTFESGETFDSSKGRDPLEFAIASGMVIPGMDKAVKEMEVGEEKNISIPPAEAYGNYDDKLVHSFPKEGMQNDFDPQVGMAISVKMENGQQVPATVKEVTDKEVVLDVNHPLAGKTLNFFIKLLEINDEAKHTPESCGCDCSSGCDDAGSGGGCGEPGSGCS